MHAVAATLMLAGAITLSAAPPVGPCEELLYVGQCVHVGIPPGGSPTQQPHGELIVTPNGANSIG